MSSDSLLDSIECDMSLSLFYNEASLVGYLLTDLKRPSSRVVVCRAYGDDFELTAGDFTSLLF